MTEPTHNEPENEDRLRVRPEERFDSPVEQLDLVEALKQLLSEPIPERHGHRQITVYHQRPVTIILFAFDRGGKLPEHKADGLVTIQVLEGQMRVQVSGQDYTLRAGHIVVLKSDVPHSITAVHPSAMLLTVNLDQTGGSFG